MDSLTIIQPDDWHLHVRNGAMLQTVIPHTAARFRRAIIMPNLKPPVTTVAQALAYRQEILAAAPPGLAFEPLMTLYLTAATTVAEITEAASNPYVHACKLYPAGATTNAEHGVADIKAIYPLFAAMEKLNLPLLIHAEVSDAEVDIFDREPVFVSTHLQGIVQVFPGLRVVVEHVTTIEAVDFVLAAGPNVVATITPQHLLYNRNALLAGGVRPHFYCLPILKREPHRLALVAAATSGNPKFFLGTDSAPHLTHLKEHACGCAGCFNAPVALEMYAQAFEQAGALHQLEAFASFYGADFYGLPRNQTCITLQKQAWQVPERYVNADVQLTPLLAGEQLSWRVQPA